MPQLQQSANKASLWASSVDENTLKMMISAVHWPVDEVEIKRSVILQPLFNEARRIQSPPININMLAKILLVSCLAALAFGSGRSNLTNFPSSVYKICFTVQLILEVGLFETVFCGQNLSQHRWIDSFWPRLSIEEESWQSTALEVSGFGSSLYFNISGVTNNGIICIADLIFNAKYFLLRTAFVAECLFC